MSNFVDEPPSFKERFDSINADLDEMDDVLRSGFAEVESHSIELHNVRQDLAAIKKAVGYILLGLAGQPVNIGEELMQSLGFKTSPIIPASAVVKAS